nr:MAG TPA: hypothetical protein [Caudoviricetes sp.]
MRTLRSGNDHYHYWIVMHSAIDTINPAVAGCFLIVG